ncbi:MAG: hypothetical protein GXO57_08445 [Thermodesulfobacteria bacterium]|nr:hypothetical protein [Thermodesulfobacteriota bacterium]
MSIKLHQSKAALKLLEEKTFEVILGEVLHIVWEELLKKLKITQTVEENWLINLINSALAIYPEPLSYRDKIFEHALRISKVGIKSKDFLKLKKLVKDKEVLNEVDLGFKLPEELRFLKPDLLLKGLKEWIIIELTLHYELKQKLEQLKTYFEALKTGFPLYTVKAYLLTFEPFKLEKKYEARASQTGNTYTSQLSLFKEFY